MCIEFVKQKESWQKERERKKRKEKSTKRI